MPSLPSDGRVHFELLLSLIHRPPTYRLVSRILTLPSSRGSYHFLNISSHLARQLCEVVSGSDVGLASPDYAAKLRQYVREHVDPDPQLRDKAPSLLVGFSPASA